MQQEYNSIRITADFTRLKDKLNDKQMTHIKQVFQIAQKFYSDLIKLKRLTNNNIFPSDYNCDQVKIDGSDKTKGIKDSDIHIYFDVNKLTISAACIISETGRPLFGYFLLNMEEFIIDEKQNKNQQIHKHFEIFQHQLMHVLGFSKLLYQYYQDTNGIKYNSSFYTSKIQIGEQSYSALSFPNIKKAAQNYFQCESLEGMLLENEEDTSDSHWETNTILNDIMTSKFSQTRQYFSIFDAAILKDTGWYQVNEDLIENTEWGKGKGCQFIYQSCQNSQPFSEFCTEEIECNYGNFAGGKCESSKENTECKVIKIQDNLFCQESKGSKQVDSDNQNYFGWDSRCFSSNLNYKDKSESVLSCFKSKCNHEGNKIQIFIGEKELNCSVNSEIIQLDGYTGQLNCPKNIQQFCKMEQNCQNYCNGRGYCNKQCNCIDKYLGPGCQCYDNQYYLNGYCLDKCPDQYIPDQNRICQLKVCQENESTLNCKKCFNQKCIECLSNYYLDGEICRQCGKHCKSCINKNKCIKCQENSILQDFQCKPQCESGYFSDNNNTCQLCLPNCDECSDKNSCIKCENQYYLFNNKQVCIQNCPFDYYADQFECQPCNENCIGCKNNRDKCIQCKPGTIRNRLTCVYQCDKNQFILSIYGQQSCQNCQSDCLQCSNYQSCSQCDNLMNQNGFCLLECDHKYYPDNNRICRRCHPNCLSCFGRESYQCTSCDSHYKFYKNQCFKSCPRNTFWNQETLKCQEEQGQLLQKCPQCFSGQFCYKGVCYDDCEKGYFVRIEEDVIKCEKCSVNCLFCLSPHKCLQCENKFKLQNGICIEKNHDAFLKKQQNIFKKCHQSCLTCFGIKPNQCLSCSSYQELARGYCIDTSFKQVRLRQYNGLISKRGHGRSHRRSSTHHENYGRVLSNDIYLIQIILILFVLL